jgi:hypothetical protein
MGPSKSFTADDIHRLLNAMNGAPERAMLVARGITLDAAVAKREGRHVFAGRRLCKHQWNYVRRHAVTLNPEPTNADTV